MKKLQARRPDQAEKLYKEGTLSLTEALFVATNHSLLREGYRSIETILRDTLRTVMERRGYTLIKAEVTAVGLNTGVMSVTAQLENGELEFDLESRMNITWPNVRLVHGMEVGMGSLTENIQQVFQMTTIDDFELQMQRFERKVDNAYAREHGYTPNEDL